MASAVAVAERTHATSSATMGAMGAFCLMLNLKYCRRNSSFLHLRGNHFRSNNVSTRCPYINYHRPPHKRFQ